MKINELLENTNYSKLPYGVRRSWDKFNAYLKDERGLASGLKPGKVVAFPTVHGEVHLGVLACKRKSDPKTWIVLFTSTRYHSPARPDAMNVAEGALYELLPGESDSEFQGPKWKKEITQYQGEQK